MHFLVSHLHEGEGGERGKRFKSTCHIKHTQRRQTVLLVDTSKLLFAKMIDVVLFLF